MHARYALSRTLFMLPGLLLLCPAPAAVSSPRARSDWLRRVCKAQAIRTRKSAASQASLPAVPGRASSGTPGEPGSLQPATPAKG
eukprot:13488873-Heterocapsa_arctica.AAC.1